MRNDKDQSDGSGTKGPASGHDEPRANPQRAADDPRKRARQDLRDAGNEAPDERPPDDPSRAPESGTP